jgi:SPIRAL1-like protein
MVRGGSSGGGQSSLGYLFGSTETPQPKPPARAPAQPPQPTVAEQRPAGLARTPPEEKPALAPAKTVEDSGSLLDMGGQNKMGRNSNNYHRADGQNTGNFITVSFLIYLLEFQRLAMLLIITLPSCLLPVSEWSQLSLSLLTYSIQKIW